MRKLRDEVKNSSITEDRGVMALFDMEIMKAFNITFEELNYIDDTATQEEVDQFVDVSLGVSTSFSDRKKALEIRDKYLKMYKNLEI